MSALIGDNVFTKSDNMPWYKNETLISTLEKYEVSKSYINEKFSMPVQWVNRTSSDFRGYSGTISSGKINVNDEITVVPSGEKAKIKKILTPDGNSDSSFENQAVTISLDKEIDISRGDLITSDLKNIKIADQFSAHIIWMHKDAMLPERNYIFRFINSYVSGKITKLEHKININSYEKIAAKSLELNDIGYCKIALSKSTFFKSYSNNNQLGSFVIIDQFNNLTVGAGMIDYELRRSTNISWHEMTIDKKKRSSMNSQKPCALWFTGLSGSGKSTIANILEQKLHQLNKRTYLLDGDNVRHGLNKDLGFTDADRVENIRRVAEVSKLMTDAGLITLVSFISPFKSERKMARDLFEKDEILEIFVDTPLQECEKRDPKGLYKKARSGKLKNFTGIDSDYEIPISPEIKLQTLSKNPEELADEILNYMKKNNII